MYSFNVIAAQTLTGKSTSCKQDTRLSKIKARLFVSCINRFVGSHRHSNFQRVSHARALRNAWGDLNSGRTFIARNASTLSLIGDFFKS
jgi:hypothetical protein